MRTKSDTDTALLTAPSQARSTYVKVEIDRDGAGTWVDLTDQYGQDYVVGVSYGENVDVPAWTAQVQLLTWGRDDPTLSLSPLMANSLLNTGGVLIQPYRKLRISTATVPMGDPKPATYQEVFLGRIDSYDLSVDGITVNCRDQWGELQDRFVEIEKDYGEDDPVGSATGNELQEIIQDMLDDHINTTASAPAGATLSGRTTDGVPFQLYSAQGNGTTPWNAADDTGWSLRRFLATKSPLAEWVLRLAEMIGFRLRFRWHEGTSVDAFVLVLEEPDRGTPASDITLDPTKGQCAVTGIALDNQRIRNVWNVGYAINGEESASVQQTNAASITKYGRRFAEVVEGSSSQIDTHNEANTMATAFLNDTKEPTATVGLRLPYVWYMQTNDIVTVVADGLHFDSNQSLACVARQNRIEQGGSATTDLTLHGTLQTGHTRRVQRQYEKQRWSRVKGSSLALSRGSKLGNSSFADIGHE
jgi:hypothetical protein